MKVGFIPITMDEYVNWHLKSNPGINKVEIEKYLRSALQAYKSGEKCRCGNPIWVIGSALTGHACFTCITGEAIPDHDFEIDEACEERYITKTK